MFEIKDLLNQAKAIQEQATLEQEKLTSQEYTGKAAAGLITVVLNGKGELIKINIDPSLLKVDDKAIVEDLIIAAHCDAKSKTDAALSSMLSGMMNIAKGSLGKF